MARPDTTKRRVSNLVGRFEQLAQAAPIRETSDPTSPTSPRPASHHGEKSWLQHERRSLSLSSMPNTSTLSAQLERELNRNAQLRQEIESLRRRCHEDDDILTTLSQQLEEGTELQASLHMQTSGLQTKVNRLADKLARRDKIQKAEYERRIVTVANERDIVAQRLKMAEARVERARVAEEKVGGAEEKIRTADEKAQIADSQISALRNQLLELKTDVAARSGKQADVSDQEILDMMNKLNHLVQNWCVSSFRKVKIEALQEARLLRKLYSMFDTSIKIFTFQATVLHLLMPIFDAHFFGLPEELQGLETAARAMQAFSEWRAATFQFLQHEDGVWQKLRQVSEAKAQARLMEHICKIMSTLTGLTVSEDQRRTLVAVVEHAVSLSRTLGRQRATYRCFLPETDEEGNLKFDVATMEDLMDEHEDDGYAKDIKCVVFPALLKMGGEQGEDVRIPYNAKRVRLTDPKQMDVRNLLLKAKVLCVEEDSDDECSVD
ncbi:unnamed protein product [Aureobasidium pullulans]|nr:unnamed protein product [Aureobasidium pullulans]